MSIASPSRNYAAVTPSDTTVFPECSYLWVGTAGDLIVTCPATGQKVTIPNASGYQAVRTTRVWAATAAQGIVAFYAP